MADEARYAGLTRRVREGAPGAQDELILANMGLVSLEVRQSLAAHPWPAMDLEGQAQYGAGALGDCASGFDPDRGNGFGAYAGGAIWNRCREARRAITERVQPSQFAGDDYDGPTCVAADAAERADAAASHAAVEAALEAYAKADPRARHAMLIARHGLGPGAPSPTRLREVGAAFGVSRRRACWVLTRSHRELGARPHGPAAAGDARPEGATRPGRS